MKTRGTTRMTKIIGMDEELESERKDASDGVTKS